MQEGLNKLSFIAIALISVSVVCGVVFFGLIQSKSLANEGFIAIVENDNRARLETVQTFMKWQGKSMPSAACYTLLKENTGLIVRVTCGICGKTTSGADVGDCLKSHINGRIRITLTEEESGGTYTAVLS